MFMLFYLKIDNLVVSLNQSLVVMCSRDNEENSTLNKKRRYLSQCCSDKGKENRIYIRVEFRQSLGMNFVTPLSA